MNTQQTTSKTGKSERGFSMVEVLVAVLVLSFGLLSIAALQGKLLRGTSESKSRLAALQLAQGQMDMFRSYACLQASPGGSVCDSADAERPAAFADIVDGRIGDGGVFDWAGANTVVRGGTEYSVEWSVEDCVSGPSPACSGSSVTLADGKEVNVTVSWFDQEVDDEGQPVAHSVALTGMIAKVSPRDAARTLAGAYNEPIVPVIDFNIKEFDPILVPTETDIRTRFRETTEPVATVVREDVSTITRFSTLVVDVDASDETRGVRNEEFAVVSCKCELARASDDLVGNSPTAWNGEKFELGQPAPGKPVGVPVDDGVNQADLCTDCCRDHHDELGAAATFDPFRPEADYNIDGNHSHYLYEGGEWTEAVNAGDPYHEVCRFTRVDGQFRVGQDFRMEAFNVMPARQLEDAGGRAEYQDYVADFVEQYVEAITFGYPLPTPDPGRFPAQFDPDGFPPGQLVANYQARGVYIDHISDELLACINSRRGAASVTETTLPHCRPEAGSFIDIVPFHELDLTGLVAWSTNVLSSISISDIGDADDGLISLAGAGLGLLTQSDAYAVINRSNSGLTGYNFTDPDDGSAGFDDPSTFDPAGDLNYPVAYGNLVASAEVVRGRGGSGPIDDGDGDAGGDGGDGDEGDGGDGGDGNGGAGASGGIVFGGNIFVSPAVQGIGSPSEVSITPATAGAECSRLDIDTYRCTISPTDLVAANDTMSIIVGDYVGTYDGLLGSAQTDDQSACSGSELRDSSDVYNGGTTSEFTVFTYFGSEIDGATTGDAFTVDFAIGPEGGAADERCANQFP